MAQRTPLYDEHVRLKAKMVEFAGYEMPLLYSGITDEHFAVRQKAGIFDVSHMGEFVFRGKHALEQLQRITTNDVSRLEVYQVQYSMMCNESGGIIDDIIVYRLPDSYLMVVNAANRAKDIAWVRKNAIDGVDIRDESDDYALIAVQGPEALALLQGITAAGGLAEMPSFHAVHTEVAGIPVLLARTGYTGEAGCELFVSPGDAGAVWRAVLKRGAEFGLKPAGLGARDSLRLEKCLRLYGNDMDETTNPLEAGLGRWVKLDKDHFIGKEAIAQSKEAGIRKKLVGFTAADRVIPRHGYAIFKDGRESGAVTSGIYSPCLEKGIGLGYVQTEHSAVGTQLEIDIRGKKGAITVVKTPFV